MEKFVVGDIVSWTSSAGGVSKNKVGPVVEVIQAGSVPYPRSGLRADRLGAPRNHESYVVKVGSLFYWPRVNGLIGLQTQTKVSMSAPTQKPKDIEIKQKPKSLINELYNIPVPKQERKLINLIGFCLDMSGSMSDLTSTAVKDFNTQLDVIRQAAKDTNQDTYIVVSYFGVNGGQYSEYSSMVKLGQPLTPITSVRNMTPSEYAAYGRTPLRDSVMSVIDEFEKFKFNPETEDVSFLIMTLTDGDENDSRTRSPDFIARLNAKQNLGNWSFAFRVPTGAKNKFVRNEGVIEGNVVEWETTVRGFEQSTIIASAATSGFYSSRASGQTATRSFYANVQADDVTIKKTLTDLTPRVRILPVVQDVEIKSFVEFHGENYKKGYGYYQLTKPEEVQDYKEVLVQDKIDGKIYGGVDSRNLLGIPHTGSIRLRPGNTGHYDVFVQSTSVNRKLINGTRMIYRTI